MNSSPIAGLTIIVAAICCDRAALSEPVSMSANAHALAIQDCTGCPSLVLVPPGRFAMGANAQDATLEGLAPQRAATEWPVHTVTIASAFYLGGTEVTRGQFAVFAHATVYRPSGPCSVYDRAQGSFVMSAVHDWRSAAIPQSENHPVVCIDWAAANAYVMWLTSRTGKHYRLPTEAEWE